jgi:hypothetical protein
MSRVSFLKYSMKTLLTIGDRELPIIMLYFCWKNLSSPESRQFSNKFPTVPLWLQPARWTILLMCGCCGAY